MKEQARLMQRMVSGRLLFAKLLRAASVIAVGGILQSCGGVSPHIDGPPWDGHESALPPDPVPRAEPRSRYGNPPSYVVFGKRYHVLQSSAGYRERGIASWYGRKFHGRRTSSGEIYDMYRMTAAHKSLPLPTYVEVRNLRNGRSAVLRVNDRGPFHDNRLIDLSYAAARKLDIVGAGTGLVEVRALTPGQAPRLARASPVMEVGYRVPPESGPRIYLQAGAFAEPERAYRLRDRLMSMNGAPVSVSEVLLDQGRLFRVRLGPLTDVTAADRLSADIVAAGMELPRIVIE